MGTNYARTEMKGLADGGWSVDVPAVTCGRKYYFKFAICVHLLFALQVKRFGRKENPREPHGDEEAPPHSASNSPY
ncbi:hypothetical protein DVH05_024070 [Phytophthora capsici]|nr:hypothetical protein DVH05_024070 [Phytophthora capsici]